MKHIGLFEGIGGFSLAAKEVGWETIAWCEINNFCQIVLKDKFPNAKGHGDINTTDFSIYRGQCDILTGGFPCQPFSIAGEQLGTEDDRHLWPEMYRAVREVQPPWVVCENVPGLISWNGGMVFEQVQADLENEGYEVQSFVLPAASVGAPHKRDRVWIVAYADSNGHELRRFREDRSKEIQGISEQEERKRIWTNNRGTCKQESFTNPTSSGQQKREQNRGRTNTKKIERGMDDRPQRLSDERITSNSETSGIQRDGSIRLKKSRTQTKKEIPGRNDTGNHWENFPTQSPVCDGNDGFSSETLRQRIREDCNGITSEKEIHQILSAAATKWRNETIKAGGNAIVHQIAVKIFKAIIKFNDHILKPFLHRKKHW